MATEDGWVSGIRARGGQVDPLPAQRGRERRPHRPHPRLCISGSYLMPTARVLARRWVNLVPDLPGYGRSERRDHVLDIPALAGALLAVLDALGIDQAVLVGNSMGCPIGLEVAHEAPERVHRLVLVSPAGGVQNQPLPARSASWHWTWFVRARAWSPSRCRTT